MKRFACVLSVVLAAGCGGSNEPAPNTAAEQAAPAAAPAAARVAPKAGWTATEGIATPESVYYDEASGFIFSSQIGGQPTDRDGNGRIVKLNGDGTAVSTSFTSGLHAPKGLRAHQGTLWTADLDEVIGIDINTGAVSSRVKIEGAQFLNDVAAGPDGTIYVSDMMGNRIYAVKDGKATVFAEGEMLEWPNGLLVDGDKLVVGGWGKPEADFTTKVPGRLFALNLQSKEKTLITPKPFGNIDGLESDGKGGYIVTDYIKGQVLRVRANGEATPIQQFTAGTADIGFVPSANILIVPHMNENKLVAYDVAEALK